MGSLLRTVRFVLVVGLAAAAAGCGPHDARQVVTIWHQSRPNEREFLADEIARYEAEHPDVRIRPLYKETEELRSGFQAAALAGAGPELVYGPSDVLDTFHTMRLIQDLSPGCPRRSGPRLSKAASPRYQPGMGLAAASWCRSATGSATTWHSSTTGTWWRILPPPPTSL